MSKKRSITYCQYTVVNKGMDIKDTSVFRQMLENLKNGDTKYRNYDLKNPEKSAGVESIEYKSDGYVWIVFKTGRYGHTAPLINREDGSERNHDKTMDEGEKELTHICLKILPEYILCAIEGNKYGIGSPLIKTYFDRFIEKINPSLSVDVAYLSIKGVQDILSKAERISSIELECSYQKSGEDVFCSLFGEGIKETFNVTFTTERRKSFKKSKTMDIYNQITTGGKFSRMKIALRTVDGEDMILDTLLDKVRDQVLSEIDSNGVIISSSIFPILQEHLKKFEE